MSIAIFDKTYTTFTRAKGRSVNCSIKGFDDLSALKMTAQDSPNTQIEFALSSDTYILDFGEKLSPINISGIIPLSTGCASAKAIRGRLSALYAAHRLGKKPVAVTIGSDAYSAYVTGKSTSISAERPEILNFSITLLGYKPGADKGSGSGSGSSDDGIGSLASVVGSSLTDPIEIATGSNGVPIGDGRVEQGEGNEIYYGSANRASDRENAYASYETTNPGKSSQVTASNTSARTNIVTAPAATRSKF